MSAIILIFFPLCVMHLFSLATIQISLLFVVVVVCFHPFKQYARGACVHECVCVMFLLFACCASQKLCL